MSFVVFPSDSHDIDSIFLFVRILNSIRKICQTGSLALKLKKIDLIACNYSTCTIEIQILTSLKYKLHKLGLKDE